MFDFQIEVKIRYSIYKLNVRRIYLDSLCEQYQISSKRRSIVLQSNRPFFRNRGIMHRKPNWTLVKGEAKNSSNLDATIEALYKKIEEMDKSR